MVDNVFVSRGVTENDKNILFESKKISHKNNRNKLFRLQTAHNQYKQIYIKE